MELEQLENWGCFCHFLGTLRVTPVNRPKKALKVIWSFWKLACHHFIAKWRCPLNLKKIGEVMDFECTFSMERAIYKSLHFAIHSYEQWSFLFNLIHFLLALSNTLSIYPPVHYCPCHSLVFFTSSSVLKPSSGYCSRSVYKVFYFINFSLHISNILSIYPSCHLFYIFLGIIYFLRLSFTILRILLLGQ